MPLSYDSEQDVPLLDDETLMRDKVPKQTTSRTHLSRLTAGLLIYSLVLSGLVAYQNLGFSSSVATPFSPVAHVIEYENQNADPDKHVVFSEPPSPEVDAAWERLTEPIYYSANFQEVLKSNDSPDDTVKLIDVDGYLGTIGVYHGLHCMRRLYWHLNEDHYFPNRTAQERQAEVVHALHCLGIIVESLMCNPDITLYTFGWDPEIDVQPYLKSGATRQCVKWDPLHEFARERAAGYFPRMQAPMNLLKKMGQGTSP